MKRLILLLISACLALSGCAGFMGDGRMEAWKDVRKSEETTKQEVLKTKQIEKQNEGKKVQQNPTLKLTSYDTAGKVVSTAELDLQPVIAEITGGKKDVDTYGIKVEETPMPKGEVAENLLAAGNASEKILNSPVAAGAVVGASVGAAIRETGGGTKINGETVNINESFNRQDNKALGSGNTVSGSHVQDKSSEAIVPEALPEALPATE